MPKTTKAKKIDFWGLTPEQQRVAIARDVLARLRSRESTLKPTKGTYFSAFCPIPSGDLQKNLQEGGPCYVCALGALFYSHVALGNGVTTRNPRTYFLGEHLREKLNQLFSLDQLWAIESAFEGTLMGFFPCPQAVAFCNGISSPKARMKKIMENIIKNNGEFDP